MRNININGTLHQISDNLYAEICKEINPSMKIGDNDCKAAAKTLTKEASVICRDVAYDFMHVRCSGQFKGKGFYLGCKDTWKIVTDNEGINVLVPANLANGIQS